MHSTYKRIKASVPSLHFVRLPILGGPLRGLWWDPMSRGKVLRYLTGTYETEQTQFFLDNVNAGDVVFDCGANLGYLSMLFSRLVGNTGKVLAFEPDPKIYASLERHLGANKCTNVLAYPVAVGADECTLAFDDGRGTGTGRISASGAIQVQQRRIDDVADEANVVPDVMKIDVEGFGAKVLEGAQNVIAESRPTIYLSCHGEAETDGAKSILGKFGYTYEQDSIGELIFRADRSSRRQAA